MQSEPISISITNGHPTQTVSLIYYSIESDQINCQALPMHIMLAIDFGYPFIAYFVRAKPWIEGCYHCHCLLAIYPNRFSDGGDDGVGLYPWNNPKRVLTPTHIFYSPLLHDYDDWKWTKVSWSSSPINKLIRRGSSLLLPLLLHSQSLYRPIT